MVDSPHHVAVASNAPTMAGNGAGSIAGGLRCQPLLASPPIHQRHTVNPNTIRAASSAHSPSMNSKNCVSTVSPPRHGRFHQIFGVLFLLGFSLLRKTCLFSNFRPPENLHNSNVASRDECEHLLILKSVALKGPPNQHQIACHGMDGVLRTVLWLSSWKG